MKVANTSVVPQILMCIREFIQERNLMIVKNAAKPLSSAQSLLTIREFILDRNLTNVVNGSYHSLVLHIVLCIREFIQEKPYKYKECGKALMQCLYLTGKKSKRIHSGQKPYQIYRMQQMFFMSIITYS